MLTRDHRRRHGQVLAAAARDSTPRRPLGNAWATAGSRRSGWLAPFRRADSPSATAASGHLDCADIARSGRRAGGRPMSLPAAVTSPNCRQRRSTATIRPLLLV